MCHHLFHKTAGLHVPAEQLVPDPGHRQFVPLREHDLAAQVEPLRDIPDSVRKIEILELVTLQVPELEPVENSGATPGLSLGKIEHQNLGI